VGKLVSKFVSTIVDIFGTAKAGAFGSAVCAVVQFLVICLII